MTEEEWLDCYNVETLLDVILDRASSRKMRLLAAAACSAACTILVQPYSSAVVEVVERYADGLASSQELSKAAANAWDVSNRWAVGPEPPLASAEAFSEFFQRADTHEALAWAASEEGTTERDTVAVLSRALFMLWTSGIDLCDFLRDIFGNPFRPVAFDGRWRTTNVVELARTIYDERTFDRLPILADALLDAGCNNDDILSHCRSDGPHVRGCWAVDLVLGKE